MELLNKIISKIYCVVYQQKGLKSISEIDMHIGIEFNDEFYEIYISKNDIWTPCIEKVTRPKNILKIQSSDLNEMSLIELSTNGITNEYLYYDVSETEEFSRFIGQCILKIEKLIVNKNIEEVFGLKISFSDNYIMVFPSEDGSSIKTDAFLKNLGLANFSYLGKINTIPYS